MNDLEKLDANCKEAQDIYEELIHAVSLAICARDEGCADDDEDLGMKYSCMTAHLSTLTAELQGIMELAGTHYHNTLNLDFSSLRESGGGVVQEKKVQEEIC